MNDELSPFQKQVFDILSKIKGVSVTVNEAVALTKHRMYGS